MPKSNTKSFILELKLNAEIFQIQILNKRFEIARKMYNSTLSYALKQLKLMQENKEYKDALNNYIEAKKNNDKYNIKLHLETLNNIRLSFCLSDYHLQEYIIKSKRNYESHIDINTSQKIASTVWKATSDVLFKKGNKVHFKKFGELLSIEGKSNKQGIRFKDNFLMWNGLKISVKIRNNDIFAKESLENHNIKYCRIIKKIIGNKETFYLQLILEGVPPEKKVNSTGELRHKLSENKRVGIDLGTSTIAIVSQDIAELKELAPNIMKYEKEINMLLRYLGRSKRATNPFNYNKDGTIKRDIKLKWIRSKKYIKALFKLKNLYRLKSQYINKTHNKLCNFILKLGDEIYTEEMNFRALAKRSKKTEISVKTGNLKKKKRFGKSILNKAPSKVLTILNRKLNYQDKELIKVNTRKYRASQYNHVTDTYKKKKLSQRWNYIDNCKIQRDLYSAFLLMCAKDKTKPDKALCNKEFHEFKKNHNECIEKIKYSDNKLINSFGIKKIA
ncbi:MAG: hypothetical protein K0R54_1831 [Clostridiaceae bacterium]|jgi:hypothetical protein|nr:hypothetical protein [Clostridiaceae bacterium]